MSVVVDASAVLAILRDERGADAALAQARGARLSAVNFSELLAKAGDKGYAVDDVATLVAGLELVVVPFDAEAALAAARFRPATRGRDVSFADRACLALAHMLGVPALTADTKWADLDLGVEVRLIREKR